MNLSAEEAQTAKQPMQDGLLHGCVEEYDDAGQLQQQAHYQKGQLEGETLIYGPDGQVLQRLNFQQNQLQGQAKIYQNQQCIQITHYHQGLREGELKIFNELGQLIALEQYQQGLKQGECCAFNQLGVLIKKHFYQHGLREGEGFDYYPSGEVYLSQHFVKDNPHGKWLRYNTEQQLIEKSVYEHGNLLKMEHYNEKGQVIDNALITKKKSKKTIGLFNRFLQWFNPPA